MTEKLSEATALFDLDGTLADFDLAIREGLQSLAAPGEKAYYLEQADEPEYIKNRRRLIKTQPGFWRNLKGYQPGYEILQQTIKLGYKHMILSKGPRSNPQAWAEKIEWVRAMFPSLDDGEVKITLTEDKGLIYGKVLVDDWPAYVDRWLEWRTRGLVIMPAHEWNIGFKHPNVVRYDGKNLPEVIERLTIQRATAGE